MAKLIRDIWDNLYFWKKGFHFVVILTLKCPSRLCQKLSLQDFIHLRNLLPYIQSSHVYLVFFTASSIEKKNFNACVNLVRIIVFQCQVWQFELVGSYVDFALLEMLTFMTVYMLVYCGGAGGNPVLYIGFLDIFSTY